MTSSAINIYFNKIYFTKKKNMFRFDTFPVFFFLCAMFGVTISGCQLCGVNMKSLSPLANAVVPHPEITPRDPRSFQQTRCGCQSRSRRSCTGRIPKRPGRVAATWSDSNDFTVQSFEGDGKNPSLAVKTLTGLIALLSLKGPVQKPTKDFRFFRFF